MKKAVSFIIIAAVLCAVLTACSNRTGSDNDNFLIVIHQNTENDIYGIHYEYLLDGIPIGGAEVMSVIRETVTPFNPGDEISLLFDKQKFPENSDLSKLMVEIYVIEQDGSEIKTENDIALSAELGGKYLFDLTGNSDCYSINSTVTE